METIRVNEDRHRDFISNTYKNSYSSVSKANNPIKNWPKI